CFCITLTHIFYIRLKQNYDLLRRSSQYSFNRILYGCFHRNCFSTLVLFFRANKLYGDLFFAFLAVNCPVSAYLVMWIVMGEIEGIRVLFIATIAFDQMCLTILMHGLIANYSAHIHRPGKLLFHFFTKADRSDQVCPLKLRLRLEHDIGALHVKKK